MKSNVWKTHLVLVIVVLFVGVYMHRTCLGGVKSENGGGAQRDVTQARLQRSSTLTVFQRSPRRRVL